MTWTTTPVKWSNDFFKHLFEYDWELTESPAGAKQWKPKNGAGAAPSRPPTIRREDRAGHADHGPRASARSGYEKIARRFYENPQEFADAFAKAWFKLTHRDMGPITRYLGPEVPKEPQIWQDPVPAVTHD